MQLSTLRRNLNEYSIGVEDNEGKTIFTVSAQAALLQVSIHLFFAYMMHHPARPNGRHAGAEVLNSGLTKRSRIETSQGAGPDAIHTQIVRWLADFLAQA